MDTAAKNTYAAAWPWAVLDNDGIIVNRFTTEADAEAWSKGFYRVASVPVPAECDIF